MRAAFPIVQGLALPDRAFGSGESVGFSRLALVVVAICALLIAEVVTVRALPHDLGRELFLRRELNRLEALLLNAPPRQYERARLQAEATAQAAFGPTSIGAGMILRAGRWVVLYFEVLLLLRILVQFAGGEEPIPRSRLPAEPSAATQLRPKVRRRSRAVDLVMVSLLPLVIARLLSALVLSFTADMGSVSSYEEYVAASKVSLSIAGAVGFDVSSPILQFILDWLTHPFVWWSLYIFILAAESVYRLSRTSAAAVAGALVVVLSIQDAVLHALGLQ